VSGEYAENGIARDVFLGLMKKYTDASFEVIEVQTGSPEAFTYMDEYLAIACEDVNPVVFVNGTKVCNGSSDIVHIVDEIGCLLV